MPEIRPGQEETPTLLVDRIAAIHDWYKGMVSAQSGRLLYEYDPESDAAIANGNPIRNIAAIRDVQLVSDYLDRSELDAVVERSLQHYGDYITARDGALILDSEGLGEPSSIAHSAFMILALAATDSPARRPTIKSLAEGILNQQREDGSFEIYFGGQEDDGLEFYPGEAMLALMQTYEMGDEPRHLISVERGFNYYSDRFDPDNVSDRLRIFYANWQSQYGLLLYEMTDTETMRTAVRDYIFALHDRTIASGFYERLEDHPGRHATVQVASALEGLNDAYTIAEHEEDDERLATYATCIRSALSWLLRAQRFADAVPRERGGFGHSMTDRTQRIDVTGHAASGFIKCVDNDILPLSSST